MCLLSYCVFGTFCFAATIHLFFLFQKTCGKSLEEIDIIFEENIWAFKAKQEPSCLAADIKQARKDLSVEFGMFDNARNIKTLILAMEPPGLGNGQVQT
ncbi:uncharacterized protein N7484_003272 [Penicillium longicatenatum]|uniref:uncharacterized protein n=1 Tax=Penicillium longicatenatum TaxID=1561947 RepID=UPI002547316F|nr:uncharacterized protein N7484_003272 [Penicillium longicatenatum]KAJ5649549.1 hypothetical protein N7484_003272 [Penicillium longicatenatum]